MADEVAPRGAVEDWLAYQARRGRSTTTIQSYRSTMRAYLDDPLGATLEEAERWWEGQDHLSPRTRSAHLSCVRSFYKWAMRYDLVERDPTRRLDPPTLPKGAPRYITRDQLDKLLAELPGDLRRAVVLGAWAGLRVSEVAALDWQDVDLEAHRLHVRDGKGGKSRTVGIAPLLVDQLLPVTGGNVVTGGGTEPTANALQQRVNRSMKQAGVDATFHQLRHRFGTITYGVTGDPLAVAAAMGHASLETTRIYAAVSDEALDRVAAAAVR